MLPRARMLAAALVVLIVATAAALWLRESPAESDRPEWPRERGPNAEDSNRDAGRAGEEAPTPGIPADEPDAVSADLPGDAPDADNSGGDAAEEDERAEADATAEEEATA